MTQTQPRGPRGGVCRYCKKEVGGVVIHERHCLKRDNEAELARMESFLSRAAAHTRLPQDTPVSQRWRNKVTDEDVAAVLYAIESEGMDIRRSPLTGRWLADTSVMPWNANRKRQGLGVHLSNVINEMIRTGLVTHWVERTPGEDIDHLVPARVHLADPDDPRYSACRWPMEDVGPMRTRLTRDLALVDCLECEAAVRRGGPRVAGEL
jgi:hypothetical protein